MRKLKLEDISYHFLSDNLIINNDVYMVKNFTVAPVNKNYAIITTELIKKNETAATKELIFIFDKNEGQLTVQGSPECLIDIKPAEVFD